MGTIDIGSGDFTETPWLYPGVRPARGGLLDGGVYHRLTPREDGRLGRAWVESHGAEGSSTLNNALRRSDAVGVDKRYVVVAVGSNSSPAVMLRKFTSGGVSTTVPFVGGTVDGLAVGHSAHVSVPGFVAATPVYRPGARTHVFVSLLDRNQLICLDATEPNYVRRSVRAERCRLELEGGEHPSSFLLYASRWGVLTPPGCSAVPLHSQDELFERLLRGLPGFAELVGWDGAASRMVMTKLAQDEELRAATRRSMARAGWAARSGFEDCPADLDPPRYGLITSTWS